MSNKRLATPSRLRRFLRKASDPIYEAKRQGRLRIARFWRQRCKDTIFIGVTGSHGKTTATSLLGAILDRKAPTHLSQRHNQSKSVARTILSTSAKVHRYAVIEVSGDEPGAVEKSVSCLLPDAAIVTAVGGDHRKAFGGSWEATAAEKAKLVQSISPDGLAVLNADDPLVIAMRGKCRCRVVTFGRAESADLRLIDSVSDWPGRLNLDVEYRDEKFAVKSQLVGAHWSVSIMAALLTALELGVTRADCLPAIAAFEPVFSRMSVHRAPNGAWIVLDADKGSFSGISGCLGFLDTASAPRKTAVFGSLADYPGASRAHYQQAARMALAKADRVIFTGPNASRVRRLADGEFAGRLFVQEDPNAVAEIISRDSIRDEIIYVKSARTDGLWRAFLSNRQR